MMVLAQAIVDVVWAPNQASMAVFRVTVTGQPPHAQERVYTLSAKSDTLAAQEGIRLFVEEMEPSPAV
jgi:hypothetical protein